MKTGTLRLLAFMGTELVNNPHHEYALLRAWDAPPSADFRLLPWTTDGSAGDELGDYETKPVPDLPAYSGLWVLVWPWRMVQHPEDQSDTTARYGSGFWRRPTLEELYQLTTQAVAA